MFSLDVKSPIYGKVNRFIKYMYSINEWKSSKIIKDMFFMIYNKIVDIQKMNFLIFIC